MNNLGFGNIDNDVECQVL